MRLRLRLGRQVAPLLFLASAALPALAAQSAHLVKDIGSRTIPDSSNPTPNVILNTEAQFVQVGQRFFFVASNFDLGPELYVSDGTTAGTRLVKELWPGRPGARPNDLLAWKGVLYFTAEDGASGRELWRSDGTASGTYMLTEGLSPGAAGITPSTLTPFGNHIAFVGLAREVLVTDGTVAGTRRVRSFSRGSRILGVLGNTLYLSADDGAGLGAELWASDGTSAGTSLVRNIATGTSSSTPRYWQAVGNTAYFTANTAAEGRELWKTDGTSAGTSLVRDLRVGRSSGLPFRPRFAVLGQRLLFAGRESFEMQLWSTDGTANGTTEVAKLNVASSIRVAGGRAWFGASTPAAGFELWSTDGSASGTRVIDLNPGSKRGFVHGPYNVAGLVVFSGLRPDVGQELFVASPAGNAASLLGDVLPGPESSAPAHPTLVGSKLVMAANGSKRIGRELFCFDPATRTSKLLFDLSPDVTTSNGFVRVGRDDFGTLYLAADDGATGSELWKSDGTTSGTQLVYDTWPGGLGGFSVFGARLGNSQFFVARDSVAGRELWKTDGTSMGTSRVTDLVPGAGSNQIGSIVRFGDKIYFSSNSRQYGQELFVTDGTASGTKVVKDIRPGVVGSGVRNITTYQGKLWFAANDGVTGTELWSSDGTEQGSKLFADLSTGSSILTAFGTMGGQLYFHLISNETAKTGLWVTDGTVAGTKLVKQIHPGGRSTILSMATLGNRLFFGVDDGTHGFELWTSDGTSAGTQLVRDIRSGSASGMNPANATCHAVGDRVYFAADDGSTGFEIWSSQGTAATTKLELDFPPVGVGSNPAGFVASNGKLFVSLFNTKIGAELYELRVDHGYTAARGRSCGSLDVALDAGVPSLGKTFRMEASNASSAVGVVFAAPPSSRTTLLACEDYVGLTTAIPLGILPGGMSNGFDVAIPDDPKLHGLVLQTQAWVLAQASSQVIQASNAVILRVGR